jgi:hypothetical protein
MQKNATTLPLTKSVKNRRLLHQGFQLYLEGLSYREIERISEFRMSPSAIG